MSKSLSPVSLWFNQTILKCLCDTTTSDMSAEGYLERSPSKPNIPKEKSKQQALDVVHAKVILGVIGVIGGIITMWKANFWIGIGCFGIGLILLADVSVDWRVGYKKHHSLQPQVAK